MQLIDKDSSEVHELHTSFEAYPILYHEKRDGVVQVVANGISFYVIKQAWVSEVQKVENLTIWGGYMIRVHRPLWWGERVDLDGKKG